MFFIHKDGIRIAPGITCHTLVQWPQRMGIKSQPTMLCATVVATVVAQYANITMKHSITDAVAHREP
jgi:hypothetical protein